MKKWLQQKFAAKSTFGNLNAPGYLTSFSLRGRTRAAGMRFYLTRPQVSLSGEVATSIVE